MIALADPSQHLFNRARHRLTEDILGVLCYERATSLRGEQEAHRQASTMGDCPAPPDSLRAPHKLGDWKESPSPPHTEAKSGAQTAQASLPSVWVWLPVRCVAASKTTDSIRAGPPHVGVKRQLALRPMARCSPRCSARSRPVIGDRPPRSFAMQRSARRAGTSCCIAIEVGEVEILQGGKITATTNRSLMGNNAPVSPWELCAFRSSLREPAAQQLASLRVLCCSSLSPPFSLNHVFLPFNPCTCSVPTL